MPLSEHVYCVAITFKMTERAEQQICIKFCIKLDRSSVETIQMIQKAAAMGNWWLAASSWQCTSSCIMSCEEFFGEIIITQVTQLPYSPDLMPWDFWLFLKVLKGKRFQTISEIQENMMGQLMAIGRTVRDPKVPTLKETDVSLSCVQCISYLLQ